MVQTQRNAAVTALLTLPLWLLLSAVCIRAGTSSSPCPNTITTSRSGGDGGGASLPDGSGSSSSSSSPSSPSCQLSIEEPEAIQFLYANVMASLCMSGMDQNTKSQLRRMSTTQPEGCLSAGKRCSVRFVNMLKVVRANNCPGGPVSYQQYELEADLEHRALKAEQDRQQVEWARKQVELDRESKAEEQATMAVVRRRKLLQALIQEREELKGVMSAKVHRDEEALRGANTPMPTLEEVVEDAGQLSADLQIRDDIYSAVNQWWIVFLLGLGSLALFLWATTSVDFVDQLRSLSFLYIVPPKRADESKRGTAGRSLSESQKLRNGQLRQLLILVFRHNDEKLFARKMKLIITLVYCTLVLLCIGYALVPQLMASPSAGNSLFSRCESFVLKWVPTDVSSLYLLSKWVPSLLVVCICVYCAGGTAIDLLWETHASFHSYWYADTTEIDDLFDAVNNGEEDDDGLDDEVRPAERINQ